jgi:hypothetical protein
MAGQRWSASCAFATGEASGNRKSAPAGVVSRAARYRAIDPGAGGEAVGVRSRRIALGTERRSSAAGNSEPATRVQMACLPLIDTKCQCGIDSVLRIHGVRTV